MRLLLVGILVFLPLTAQAEHIDSNVLAKASLRTKTVSWWRQLNKSALFTRVRDETAETPRETGVRSREGRRHT